MRFSIIHALAIVLFLSLSLPCLADGAKSLYDRQVQQSELKSKAKVQNLGLTYAIELERDGKKSYVDSRFPFQSRDQLRFHIESNIDGYLYILQKQGTSGASALLFPAPGSAEDNFVKAGNDTLLPAKGVFEFDDKEGTETLKLVLSPVRLPDNPDKYARSILITPKRNAESVAANCLVEFALKDKCTALTSKPSLDGKFDRQAAVTVVSTEIGKPLALELLLQHGVNADLQSLALHNGANRSPDSASQTNVSKIPVQKVTDSRVVADKWAIVVGISEFKNPKWNLLYPAKDARDFADFLIKEGNFAADHVKVLLNAQATRENILTVLGSKWLPDNAKAGDLVVIYFASHGTSSTQDAAGKNFLLAYDTNPANAFATGIELQDLARTVKRRIKADRIVIVLDSCHSGSAEPGAKALFPPHSFRIDELVQGSGQLVIASAADNQIAHDSLRYKNGIFTKHFIDGLRKNKKLSDVYEYTKTKVDEESKRDFRQAQEPVLKDAEWKGTDVILVVPPARPRAAVNL